MAEERAGWAGGWPPSCPASRVATRGCARFRSSWCGRTRASPARSFDEEALTRLAESIRTRGVLQPIVVGPCPSGHYELVAGERRLRAAREAGLETIPALLREADERDQLDIALAENMARVDLNPVEEARACAMLVEDLGLTKEELGRRVGRSRVAISNLIRLLDLPDEALDLIESRELSEGHGRAILLCKDHAPAQEPGPRRPRRRLVGARDRAAGTGGGARPSRWAGGAARGPSIRTSSRLSRRRRTRCRQPSGRRSDAGAPGTGCQAQIDFAAPPTPSRWPSGSWPGWPAGRPDLAATIAVRGRLAQSVRARL